MADLVEEILKAAAEKDAKYKTTEVEKAIDVEIDEGNLVSFDANPIEEKLFRSNPQDYLLSLARDNAQLLVNKLWQLPVERIDNVVVAHLPKPKTIMPREKPAPKVRPPTKWQQYARLKGITKRKKGRMGWDPVQKDWRPKWGYKRVNDEKQDWVLEVPDNADPYEDQFQKRIKAKKESVAKNELHRLRNIARSQKSKVPGVGLTPTEAPTKDYVTKALAVAKTSTASIGKFTDSLPKEKPSKYSGKKRKFEPNHSDLKNERKNQMDILDRLHSKQPALEITKAVNQQIAKEDVSRVHSRENNPQKKGGSRKKAGKVNKFANKNKKGQTKNRRGGKR